MILKQSLIPRQDDPENGRIGVGKPLGNAHQNAAWLLYVERQIGKMEWPLRIVLEAHLGCIWGLLSDDPVVAFLTNSEITRDSS
jgi:hypothetical protein